MREGWKSVCDLWAEWEPHWGWSLDVGPTGLSYSILLCGLQLNQAMVAVCHARRLADKLEWERNALGGHAEISPSSGLMQDGMNRNKLEHPKHLSPSWLLLKLQTNHSNQAKSMGRWGWNLNGGANRRGEKRSQRWHVPNKPWGRCWGWDSFQRWVFSDEGCCGVPELRLGWSRNEYF